MIRVDSSAVRGSSSRSGLSRVNTSIHRSGPASSESDSSASGVPANAATNKNVGRKSRTPSWAGVGNIRAIGHVGTADHNAFNCSAQAVLNVARDSMAAVGFYPATRVFEAAGAGACLITDAWEGIELFLQPETEVLVARDGADVAEHLRRLTPARAREIAHAARTRILAGHTYAQRAAIVDSLLRETLLASS